MKKITRKQFKVRGVGCFPLDMLRYDACWPATGADASAMYFYPGDPANGDDYSVTLSTDCVHAPTIDRWASFGWTVIDEG